MFFQLGTRQYNGLSSFISFGEQSEAVIVEYALIGRKPLLQGMANSLDVISISFSFHNSFCNVQEEVNALKKSKSSYEVLPLLSGSGILYGEYVITSINIDHTQMDDFGNTTGADVSITLKENVQPDKQQQLQQNAAKNAIATGNKQPISKIQRVNSVSSNAQVSQLSQTINSNSAPALAFCQTYTGSQNTYPCIQMLNGIAGAANTLGAGAAAGKYAGINNTAAVTDACNSITSVTDGLAQALAAAQPAAVSDAADQLATGINSLNALVRQNLIQAAIGR